MFSYSKLIEEKSSQNKIKNVHENLESSSDTSVLKYLNPFFIRKAMSIITNAINLKTESKSLSKGSKVTSHARYFLFIVTIDKEQIENFQYWLQWAKLAGFVKKRFGFCDGCRIGSYCSLQKFEHI